jgi:hypothetical protein
MTFNEALASTRGLSESLVIILIEFVVELVLLLLSFSFLFEPHVNIPLRTGQGSPLAC